MKYAVNRNAIEYSNSWLYNDGIIEGKTLSKFPTYEANYRQDSQLYYSDKPTDNFNEQLYYLPFAISID
jgi:hypothetical protein